ncbi:MAG: AMP-binding protein [Termitinemataceae bacterium]|nr:MAG: AMP-binding protein [Termitinemataceae bacterium]
MNDLFPISKFQADSRPPDSVVCYENLYSDNVYLKWSDFLEGTARLRTAIKKNGSSKCLLHIEDCWHFLLALTALLQCKKEVLLTANISPSYLSEILEDGTPLISDQNVKGALQVSDLLKSEKDESDFPKIIAEESTIVLYTSGTTGKPKIVRKRLSELERDNAYILSKWQSEYDKRKLVSTVSQHHIYGLLYAIMLPFTAGTPFRRTRLIYPQEFEKLERDSYMIITVPAFLKRTVDLYDVPLPLQDPYIWTSGGEVDFEIAKKANHILKAWPFEGYGSTETFGIGWRISKNGMDWIPYGNVQISKNKEGCLVVRSPYILEADGFATGDLVDIHSNGHFTLLGRADSIVKIEEKRISLTEVEARITQSNLVSDVCVVALEDSRQYLAAAIVFNQAGKEKFKTAEKMEINRYFTEYLLQFFESIIVPKKWRFIDEMPMDIQGKKKKLDIEALFKSGVNK